MLSIFVFSDMLEFRVRWIYVEKLSLFLLLVLSDLWEGGRERERERERERHRDSQGVLNTQTLTHEKQCLDPGHLYTNTP